MGVIIITTAKTTVPTRTPGYEISLKRKQTKQKTTAMETATATKLLQLSRENWWVGVA